MGGGKMRFYKGRWHCQGRSWPTLHEALLTAWPKGKQTQEGQKISAHGAANTKSGKGEKGLENAYFTPDYTTRAGAAQA